MISQTKISSVIWVKFTDVGRSHIYPDPEQLAVGYTNIYLVRKANRRHVAYKASRLATASIVSSRYQHFCNISSVLSIRTDSKILGT